MSEKNDAVIGSVNLLAVGADPTTLAVNQKGLHDEDERIGTHWY